MSKRVIDVATGEEIFVPDAQAADGIQRGWYKPTDTQVFTDPHTGIDMETDSPESLRERGYLPEDLQTNIAASEQARKEREHGGLGSQVLGGIEGVASAATMGATDAAARWLAPEYAERARERAEVGPGRTIGEAIGVLIPGAGVGRVGQIAREVTPLGRVAKWSEKAIEQGRRWRGYVGEGLVVGGFEGANEVVMSDDPVTVERLVSAVGTGAATGAGIGGAFAATHSVGAKLWARQLEKRMAQKTVEGASSDIASMSKAELKAARRAEADLIKNEAKAARDVELRRYQDEELLAEGNQIVEDVARYVDDEGRLFRVASDDIEGGSGMEAFSQYGARLKGARRKVRSHLNRRKVVAENPNVLRNALVEEEQVIDDLIRNKGAFTEKLAKQNVDMAKKIRNMKGVGATKTLKGSIAHRYGDWAGTPIKKKVAAEGIEVSAENLQAFHDALVGEEILKSQLRILDDIDAMKAENARIQKAIEDRRFRYKNPSTPKLIELDNIIENPASQRLDELDDAIAAADRPDGVIGMLVDKAAGMVPGGRAALAMFNRRAANAANDVAERSWKAAESAVKAAKKSAPSLVPLATKVLTEARLGPEEPPKKPRSLAEAYEARAEQIRQQVMMGPVGPVVTPMARKAIAENLMGVGQLDPLLADKMEAVAARQIEFLAAKLPKVPESQVMYGKAISRVPDMAMRKWARYVAAVIDPGGVEERVARGTVSPEDVEAMQTVYPARYEAYRDMLLEKLTELRETLPHQNRVALSLYSGVPVDPAMRPEILQVLQGNFADEPGTQGGMMAPVAAPQFGSISRPEGTPAQERMK